MRWFILFLVSSTLYADLPVMYINGQKLSNESTKRIMILMKQQVEQKTTVEAKQESNASYIVGSMDKPVKKFIIEVYQETSVDVEQKQQQIAKLMAQLQQLQETKVKVDPKIKVLVKEE